jgi:hypothetical protein
VGYPVVYKGEEREEGDNESLPLPAVILLAAVLTGLILAIAMGVMVRYSTATSIPTPPPYQPCRPWAEWPRGELCVMMETH